jgi:hypothetical protein
MTVARMLAEISSAELTEWQAYYDLEPFGDMRGDLRAGIVASTIANVMGDPKKPMSPSDFMPLLKDKPGSAQQGERLVLSDADPQVQSRLVMANVFGVTEDQIRDPYPVPEHARGHSDKARSQGPA